MLKFNFEIALIVGSVNTAADLLSRLELKDPSQNPGGCTNKCYRGENIADVADKVQFFFTQADGGDKTEEQIFQLKSNLGKCQQNVWQIRNHPQ